MKMLSPFKIVVVFVVLSGLWIALSDLVLLCIVPDPHLITKFSIAKGFLYVAVTAVFLYALVGKYAAQRDTSEKSVRENRAMLANILDAVPQSVFWKDRDSVYLGCNSVFARAAGLEHPAQVVGKTDFDLPWPREEAEAYRAGDREVMESNKPKIHIVESLERAGGTRLWIDTTKIPLVDESGRVSGVLGVYEDITERRRAEKMFRTQFENSPDIIMIIDRAYRIVEINHVLPGGQYTAEGVKGADSLELLPEETQDQVRRCLDRAFASGTLQELEHKIRHERWVNTRIVPITLDGKSPSHAMIIATDITQRKRAEQALRESEEKFRNLFEESMDTIFISTPEGKLVDINPAGMRLFGYESRAELLSLPVGKMYANPVDRVRFLSLLDRNGFATNFETSIVRRDGHHASISLAASVIRDRNGRIKLIRGIARDITEKQKLEGQLRQSQKMESVGTLAGGVAHDFNNILTAISGYCYLAITRMSGDDPLRQYLQEILQSTERAAHLTRDLLLFSRKQPIDRRQVDVNELVRKLGAFLSRIIGEDVVFKTVFSGENLRVFADSHQIDQALLNLAANARDAMPRGGIFTISTEEVMVNEEAASEQGFDKPGAYALLTVSDTGHGMDEETAQRIFEPFFTTKETGKGTGLGLAVVYGIVKRHEGVITVESAPGQGASFRIYLPLIPPGTVLEAEQAVEEQPAGGAETILLAEDDESVREVTGHILRDFGYTVITAVDGEDAVKKFSEHRNSVQLLLFDLIMPGKNGKDAYDEIKLSRPDVKIIFASGYDPDQVRQKALLEQKVPVVYKPVPINALLKKIRSVLDGQEG